MLFSPLLAAAVALLAPSLADAYAVGKTGCYSKIPGFAKTYTEQFQAASACSTRCVPIGKPFMAILNEDCYCGSALPPKSNKVDDSKCDKICPGYGPDMCGSEDGQYYSTWSDGMTDPAKNDDISSSSTKPTPSKATEEPESKATSPSVVTNYVGGQTVIVTQSPEVQKEESSGPNKAGIAAGVVVGVIAIAAAIGGMWFFLRARNRRELEDAHRRQAAINAFVKSPSDAPAFDTRLEPAIMRRMSAGSIADNQDYSRRILKVTNA
ncbi:Protein SLG1 [Pseudogymnoascus australis]